MATVTTGKRITYADYLKIDDNNRYEIINRELHMVPAPTTDHQGVSRNLEFLIWNFVKERELGKVFDDEDVFQPDIVFIKSERQSIISKNAIQGVPDLIVEIGA